MAITPIGHEPVRIRNRIETLFAKLNEAYPDRVIISLAKDHKKWAETVSELYRQLGYASGDDFLQAYGYTVEHPKTGRKSSDHMAVIEELKRRYPAGSDFATFGDLVKANPDLSASLKSLSNKAGDILGMTMAEYLKDMGLLSDKRGSLEKKIIELKKRYATGRPLPDTMFQLKRDNQDLKISSIDQLIRTTLGREPLEYLQEQGLLIPRPEASLESPEEMNEWLSEFVEKLRQRYTEKGMEPSFAALKKNNDDLEYDTASRIAAKLDKGSLPQLLTAEGLISKRGGVFVRETPRYNPTEEMIREKYRAEEKDLERFYKALDKMTREVVNLLPDRDDVISMARRGNVHDYNAACHIAPNGTQITIAAKLIVASQAKDKFFTQFKTGPIELVRDTENQVSAQKGYPFRGIVAMNEKGVVAGSLPWNYSLPISPLWDLGKVRIENTALEKADGRYLVVSFDIVLIDWILPSVEKHNEETREQAEGLDKLIRENDRRPFAAKTVPPGLEENFSKMTYFTGALFRGLDADVYNALQSIGVPVWNISSRMKKLYPGISQFECECGHVIDVLKGFPNLRAVFFAEDWRNDTAYLAYSESGYSSVTELRLIGTCHFCSERWTLQHDPTEDSFSFGSGIYEFAEKPFWEKFDFVLPDGQTRVLGEKQLDDETQHKNGSKKPCAVIEIHFPE